ncbi:hypothetical protein B0H19DRAFT_1130801 [Mycena capillaripes]|nr:hypothetical protein B0H19DRAFT_1130801 [Mycena capillaripes]
MIKICAKVAGIGLLCLCDALGNSERQKSTFRRITLGQYLRDLPSIFLCVVGGRLLPKENDLFPAHIFYEPRKPVKRGDEVEKYAHSRLHRIRAFAVDKKAPCSFSATYNGMRRLPPRFIVL